MRYIKENYALPECLDDWNPTCRLFEWFPEYAIKFFQGKEAYIVCKLLGSELVFPKAELILAMEKLANKKLNEYIKREGMGSF